MYRSTEFAKGTELWPEKKHWEDSISSFETSEDHPEPSYIKYWLRNYAARHSAKAKASFW